MFTYTSIARIGQRLRQVLGLGVVTALCWILGHAGAGRFVQAQAGRQAATVPFVMLPTNHMLVEAKLNGKGPYHLVFDLGAPITLLGNQVSEVTGVVKKSAKKSFLLGMRGEATLASLEAGELKTQNVPVLILDHPILTALAQVNHHQIHGIMGFTFFARFKTTIDYQTRKMTFQPVNFPIRDLFKELPDRLAGTRTPERKILAPAALWGMELGKAAHDLDHPGVAIKHVLAKSPAYQGGLRDGDLLVEIDGRWITSIQDVFQAVKSIKPGAKSQVIVVRNGHDLPLTIKPQDGT